MTMIEETDSEDIDKNTIDANKNVDAEEKKIIKTTEKLITYFGSKERKYQYVFYY